MKYFFILFLLILPFTQCLNRQDEETLVGLPNDFLINEALTAVIKLDSLYESNLGRSQLFFPFVYSMPKWDRNSGTSPPIPSIPPPPYKLQFGITFEEVSLYFNTVKEPKQRHKDSLFIIRQNDTLINHIISKEVSLLFKKKKMDYYWFSLPIFSSDKKTAIVAYSEENYFSYLTIIRKVDDRWTRIDHKMTWMQ